MTRIQTIGRRTLLLWAGCAWTAAAGTTGDWNRVFSGEDVTGADVVAVWQFQPGTEMKDGKGAADLTLSGKSQVVTDERFGGALESFYSGQDDDVRQGAATKWSLDLTPKGAFTLEAWVKLKAEPANPAWRSSYILDKMYVPGTSEKPGFNRDYFFRLLRSGNGKTYQLNAGVGLGTEVISFTSDAREIPPETWTYTAFCYDGKGTGMFFVNGDMAGRKTYAGKGVPVPGSRNVSLGERCGSHHAGLPGYLAQVRISRGIPAYLVGPITVRIRHQYQRTAFERMERGQTLLVTIENSTGRDLTGAVLDVDSGFGRSRMDVGPLAFEPREVTVPLVCDGRPGRYTLTATVTGKVAGRTVNGRGTFDWDLCARLPRFMPVVMWGGASFEQMKEIGLTHRLEWMDHLDMQAWQAAAPIPFVPRMDETRQKLNEALVAGLRFLGKISPGGYLKSQKGYAEARQPHLCYDVYGKPTTHVDFSLPRIQQWGHDVGRTVANNVSMFPAVDLLLADSEFRDGNHVSFRPEPRAAFKAFAGYDIPEAVRSKGGVRYGTIPDFPRDRVIPDDDKILTFYRWFWGGGDGYPGFVSNETRGAKGNGGQLRVLWDPAVRCPSKWGSGGEVDFLGHWTYVYPDPLVMGLATDEMFAMVKGGPPHQKVTKMTQIICYRSGTTEALPEDKSKWTEWEQRLPETRFITVPPDLLEIGFWQKLARPVQAIMYHGSGSLWPSDPGGYDYTNPETAPRLAGLVKGVIRPFGPMLLDLPDRPADIAMLESFASQMFSGGATQGSMHNPVGRMHAVLCRAHLQPDIVYDETILRDGLDAYKVLVAPHCAVLTESVAGKILQWQEEGGILVADEHLVPRLMPDLLVPSYESGDKADLVAQAEELRGKLAGAYAPYGEADTPDAILRFRRFGTTDYLFVVNDKRTYGDYIGQYRRVMEKGLPLTASLTVRRGAGVVYDLRAEEIVKANQAGGGLRFPVELGPGEGRLYMITERPIAAVAVDEPGEVARGSSAALTIKVNDGSGRPVDAVAPVRVDIADSQGRVAEFSGWHAAKGGTLTLRLDVAPNDAPGTWTVEARELVSGRTARRGFAVR